MCVQWMFFEWALNPGKKGSGNDLWPLSGELYEKYRADKSDPVREQDCIFCMVCEAACPVKAIKITHHRQPLTSRNQRHSLFNTLNSYGYLYF